MKIPGFIRYFNKYVLNHITGLIARLGFGPFCIIHHVGRKSGKLYETTIQAYKVANGFMIALTYGTSIDWYRNVVAAAGCKLFYHHKLYTLGVPKKLDKETALSLFPSPERAILQAIGIQDFIRLQFA